MDINEILNQIEILIDKVLTDNNCEFEAKDQMKVLEFTKGSNYVIKYGGWIRFLNKPKEKDIEKILEEISNQTEMKVKFEEINDYRSTSFKIELFHSVNIISKDYESNLYSKYKFGHDLSNILFLNLKIVW